MTMFESWCDGNFTVSPSSSDPLLTSTVGDMSDSASSSLSVSSSPVEEPRTILSISTTFYPGAPETENSDLVLSSSDGVFFFVHRSRLLEGSSNSFGGLVPPIKETKKVVETVVSPLSESPLAEDISINDPTIDLNSILAVDDAEFSAPPDDPASTIIPVAESASILNMVLLIVYRLPMERYHPDLQLMCTAMPALVSFGYQPADFVTPTSETFRLFMAHSLTHPLVVYALAASYKLERLAVACSQNTLGVELSQISDDLATVMGPVYLRRLFFLHLGRTDALKRLLLEPPTGHLPLPNCDVDNQKALTRAWALAAAYMAVEGRPNTHTSMLSMSLEALGEHLACQKCRACLSERIQSVVQQWSAVSVTI